MKRTLSILLSAAMFTPLVSCSNGQTADDTCTAAPITDKTDNEDTWKPSKDYILEAHRGVGTDAPENTMSAFRLAVEQGYKMIELDPKFTADNKCVMLHDWSVNRTARNSDGSEIDSEKPISLLTLDEARELDYGSWFGEEYKGEQIPTLEDVLAFAIEAKIPLKFDNVMQSFTSEQLDIFFDTVEKMNAVDVVGFTASSFDYIKKVLARFPGVQIHYDGTVDSDNLALLSELVPAEQLTVWMRFNNPATSWNTTPPVSEEMSEEIHKIGKLGVWILSTEYELKKAVDKYHADVIETTGKLKPIQ